MNFIESADSHAQDVVDMADLHDLSIAHTRLTHALTDIAQWQEHYPRRYEFVAEIFAQCASAQVEPLSIDFSFGVMGLVAILGFGVDSQIHLSELLSSLNRNGKVAFISHTQNEPPNAKAQSHIVVYYAL